MPIAQGRSHGRRTSSHPLRLHRLPRTHHFRLLRRGCTGAGTEPDPQAPDSRTSVERRKPDNPRIPSEAALPQLAIAASGDYRIDALLSGYQWGMTTITYSFYEQDVFAGSYYGTETVSEVSEQVKTNVRAIMAWYGTMLNLNFVEVSETSSNIGYIRIMRSTAPSYAYAYYPYGTSLFSTAGDVHLNPSYDRLGDTNGFQNPAGEHGYTTLIHEIGHALGLKHPHDGSPNLPSPEDNHSNTVMSHNFPGESPGTPMGYDLLALQYIYGMRAYRTSNDTYQFTRSSIDQYSLGGQLFIDPTLLTKQVIWDSGGYNVIDLSGFAASSSGYRLDLNPLGWLTTNANYLTTYLNAGAVVGPGVVIGKVINSGASDTIYASPAANAFGGYGPSRVAGTDVIYGANTQDTLDLSAYARAQVFSSASGNDLLLDFGANGSVRLKDYYLSAGNQPSITYAEVTPSISIGDGTVIEGSSTRTVDFVVTLSSPSASAQTVSFATSDGTAHAGSDYVAASGVLTFTAGQTQQVITVTVSGDTANEPDETFLVTLSAPSSGIQILDGAGLGTIVNDDLAPNVLPVAVASASPTSGYAPLPVSFSSSGSYDPDGTIAIYAWTFGDGSSSTAASPQHTYSNPGAYTATLTVTDDRGGSSTTSVSITVNQNPTSVLHVSNIAMSKTSGQNGTTPKATITIVNSGGLPVSGVSVSGRWSGLANGTTSGTTDASGNVTLTAKASKRSGSFTITVTGVSKSGYTYDAGANVETTDTITAP